VSDVVDMLFVNRFEISFCLIYLCFVALVTVTSLHIQYFALVILIANFLFFRLLFIGYTGSILVVLNRPLFLSVLT
jgi:hypothetical protein